jgi:hypothetical protein
MYYTTILADEKMEYIAVSPAVGAPTSYKVWYIGKLYYSETTGCMIRFVKLSTQEILDNRASLFPV